MQAFFRLFSSVVVPLCTLAALLPLSHAWAASVQAKRDSDFLNSIGVNSAICLRGESLDKTMECVRYLGIHWIRSGIEGNPPLDKLIYLHERTGVRYSWGLGSGGTNIPELIKTGEQLAKAGALLAFEGPNEPNNWGITYQGQVGGRNLSWLPVAKLQRDLYRAVKSDPLLKKYPVWSISENGAETDNVGLQFLTIPKRANTLMPAGTKYADFANVHNYIYHPNAPGLADNKTWNAADPTSACKVDGLYVEYGLTWAHHYPGYSETQLLSLPRVTTETGALIEGALTEEVHALNLLTMYLDQFKRGWSYTAVYLLRDRVDEAGNQRFGFYRPDYTPRKAALYLHNLTTILADPGALHNPGRLAYTIPNEPVTVHDMLLQKSNGTFYLVVWDEQIEGTSTVNIQFKEKVPAMKIYDPTVGTDPIQTLTNVRNIQLTLSNHPVILEIPSASVPPPLPTGRGAPRGERPRGRHLCGQHSSRDRLFLRPLHRRALAPPESGERRG
ncbi:MAG TPA: glycosyl hydrolase [Chthonomonas sp.]|uniref:glycosyl hydrolase n=1 Tax=Chthonomonas sp. TaxID=2282153 RepID=UPI002B4AB5D1|nr:glycosyl hydrolase [Chthonomonas sp.]HLH81564.1 glycosyl hydrolase [Chthonomonas sp.]